MLSDRFALLDNGHRSVLRPGHTGTRRGELKRELRRAERHSIKWVLRRVVNGGTHIERSPGLSGARSEVGYRHGANSTYRSHNTKPRYKDKHDLGIRGMAVKLAFEWRLVARFGGELPWTGVKWVQWLS